MDYCEVQKSRCCRKCSGEKEIMRLTEENTKLKEAFKIASDDKEVVINQLIAVDDVLKDLIRLNRGNQNIYNQGVLDAVAEIRKAMESDKQDN